MSTFGGHPSSYAAGLANLEILTRERLWENSTAIGEYLIGKLREIRSPWIGDIRGRGLLIGLEVVTDTGKTPLSEARMVKLLRDIREGGMLAARNSDSVPGYYNVVLLSPPLILTRGEADTIVAAVASGLAQI